MKVGDTVTLRSLRVPELLFEVEVESFGDTFVRGPYKCPREDGSVLDIREVMGPDAKGLFYLGETHTLVDPDERPEYYAYGEH